MSNQTEHVIPNWFAVKINKTAIYDSKWLNTYGIKYVYEVYVYDENRKMHCCEGPLSYELWLVDSFVDFKNEPTEEIRNKVDEDLMENREGRIIYYHCHVLDKFPDYQKDHRPLVFDDYDWDDEDEIEKCRNDICEDYHANPSF